LYPLASDNQESGYLDLFHADGATWQHLRSFSNPVFTTSNLKRIMPTVINSTQAMINLMEENVGSGEFFDIHKHFQDLTLDILSRLALGQKECQQSHNKNMKKVTDALKGTPNTVFHIAGCIFPFLGSLLRKIRIVRDPTKELLLQLNETVKLREDQYAQGAQEELDEFGNPGPDFIDFFLEAESDKDLDLQGKDFKKSGLKTTKKLSTEEIASQCLSFLLAGCETTSSTGLGRRRTHLRAPGGDGTTGLRH
uniref:Cytochrome P450 n=1 Tax=Steinernema glaseri TaxID=37863 RepID=A0A1I7YS07_9BILA